jgi:hypothetical protein
MMEPSFMELAPWLAFLIAGIALIVLRGRFARSLVASQNRVWSLSLGGRERKISEVVAVLVGLGWIVLSSAALLQRLR